MERKNSPAAGLNEAGLRNTLKMRGRGKCIRNALVNPLVNSGCHGWDYSDGLALFFSRFHCPDSGGTGRGGPSHRGFDIAIL